MNSQSRYFWFLIGNWYTQLELHFLTIWVTALTAWPDYQLSVLQTVLSNEYGMGLSTATAAAYVNGQNALSAFFGIVGAMVLDGYLTHYGMIFCSSLFYSAGALLLYFATGGANMILFLVGLFLVAVGKSSLTYSAIALSGNQLAISFVHYFFKVIILTSAVVFGVGGWPTDFFIASVLICSITLVTFFYCKSKAKYFRKFIDKRQNPLISLLCVYVAAFKKRNLPSPRSPYTLFEGNLEHSLKPTSGKRCLMKAAIRETSGPEEVEREKWLCTITDVEECKILLHMVPICMAFLAYGLTYSIGDTFFLEQADQMDTTIGNKEIPLQAFLIIASLSKLASKQLYKVFIWKRLRGYEQTHAPAIEYAMGMVLSTLCCAVASWVAMETRASPSKMNVFLLTPQFIVFGAMDGLASDSIEEFFSAELPGSVKHYGTVFYEGIVGAGTVCAILLILATSQWLNGENPRWDRFYLLCTVIGISIFFYYSFAAVRYYCQDNQEIQVEDESQQEGGADAAEHAIDIPQESQGEKEEVPKANILSPTSFKTSALAAAVITKARLLAKKKRGFNQDKEN